MISRRPFVDTVSRIRCASNATIDDVKRRAYSSRNGFSQYLSPLFAKQLKLIQNVNVCELIMNNNNLSIFIWFDSTAKRFRTSDTANVHVIYFGWS